MKTILAFALGLGLAAAALAQTAVPDVKDAEAEVRKIDLAQSKITLKHGEIKKLDMPAMTMVFRLKDAKLAEGLAVGDKVQINVEQIDKQYVVTAIAKKAP
jgi:Cu(I)/Ag(I) efflux system periplasmic protein CusF